MRGNWLECTTGSGGTGDLTLTASHGFPLLSAPWTGFRQVRYTILEYNSDPSATNANLIRAEDGYCPINTTGPVILTRSDATTVVYASWDGTNLFPRQGNATPATKQPFGAVSANIRVICSLGAEDNPFLTPILISSGSLASVGGAIPLLGAATNASLTAIDLRSLSGFVVYFPVVWPNFGLYSQATIEISTSQTGLSTSSINVGIYEVSKTGIPGRLLADFGNLGSFASSATLTSAPLATPVFLVPGTYWFAMLAQFTGSPTTAIIVRGAPPFITNGGPFGYQTISGFAGAKVIGQTVLSDPAVFSPVTAFAGAASAVPIIGLK